MSSEASKDIGITSLQVPDEIISSIFVITSNITRKLDGSKSLPSEMLVSHVNHRWRTIAISDSLLWTNVCGLATKSLSLFQLYIERSNKSLLDVSFDLDLSSVENLSYRPYIDIIALNINRLHSLTLPSERWCDETFIALSKVQAPSLDRLSITSFHSWDFDNTHSACLFSCGAPALSYVHLENVCTNVLQSTSSNLTTLHLVFPWRPPMECIVFCEMLAPLKSLTRLCLDGMVFYESDFIASEPIHLPQLESLKVYVTHLLPQHFSFFLTTVQTPALRSLLVSSSVYELDVWNSIGEPNPPGLSKFPALCHVEHAFFIGYPSGEAELNLQVVDAFHAITHLTLLYYNAEPLLRFILERDNIPTNCSAQIWPNLTSITMHSIPSVDYEILHSILRYRVTSGRPVQILRLTDPFLTEIPDGIRHWLQDNLKLELFDHEELVENLRSRV